MEKRRRKKTTKKSLGMKPIPEKTLTKRQIAIQESKMIKALEMAKPIDGYSEDLWNRLQIAKRDVEDITRHLLTRAPIYLRQGFRFESFIYIAESDIPDREGISRIYQEREERLPLTETINWAEAKNRLEEEGNLPTKKKKAYLRAVKKK